MRTEKSRKIQCKYCIRVIQGDVRYARHIISKHPDKVQDYIKGDAY